jgi:predicted nuclease of predicted toxin-antitoxin system
VNKLDALRGAWAKMSWINLIDLVRANPPTQKEIDQVLGYRRKRAKARFYVDENFPARATAELRHLSRVITVQDSQRRGQPDENHAAYALKRGFILVTCDRDYLNEIRFPLVHCPAIVVFDFGSGSTKEIRDAFTCLERILASPQFFDKWVKIDAKRDSWTEYARCLDGTTARSRYRVYQGMIQEWIAPSGAR